MQCHFFALASPFENKLRSSREVAPIRLLTHEDWYRFDEAADRQTIIRLRSFVSCVFLLGLRLAILPFEILHEFDGMGGDIKRWFSNGITSVAKLGGLTNVKKGRMKAPPGIVLLRICDFLFSKKTVTLTFKPLVADWQMDYFGALEEKRQWKSRWISVRYYWAFAKACGLSKLLGILKEIVPVLMR